MDEPTAIKDEDAAHPIAVTWRPMFTEIVRAFTEGDYELSRGVKGVDSVESDIAEHNRNYIKEYGEVLIELPIKTWESSCAQWMGSHWDVLIDLYTEGEGLSDLVLNGKMVENNGAPHFTVGLIYVP